MRKSILCGVFCAVCGGLFACDPETTTVVFQQNTQSPTSSPGAIAKVDKANAEVTKDSKNVPSSETSQSGKAPEELMVATATATPNSIGESAPNAGNSDGYGGGVRLAAYINEILYRQGITATVELLAFQDKIYSYCGPGVLTGSKKLPSLAARIRLDEYGVKTFGCANGDKYPGPSLVLGLGANMKITDTPLMLGGGIRFRIGISEDGMLALLRKMKTDRFRQIYTLEKVNKDFSNYRELLPKIFAQVGNTEEKISAYILGSILVDVAGAYFNKTPLLEFIKEQINMNTVLIDPVDPKTVLELVKQEMLLIMKDLQRLSKDADGITDVNNYTYRSSVESIYKKYLVGKGYETIDFVINDVKNIFTGCEAVDIGPTVQIGVGIGGSGPDQPHEMQYLTKMPIEAKIPKISSNKLVSSFESTAGLQKTTNSSTIDSVLNGSSDASGSSSTNAFKADSPATIKAILNGEPRSSQDISTNVNDFSQKVAGKLNAGGIIKNCFYPLITSKIPLENSLRHTIESGLKCVDPVDDSACNAKGFLEKIVLNQ